VAGFATSRAPFGRNSGRPPFGRSFGVPPFGRTFGGLRLPASSFQFGLKSIKNFEGHQILKITLYKSLIHFTYHARMASFLSSPGRIRIGARLILAHRGCTGRIRGPHGLASFLVSPGRIQRPHQGDECSSQIDTFWL
jgi:hypothetical protein